MEIIFRPERTEDYYASELVAKRAFWNLHYPGCDEHYLVHLLRSDKDYIPELSRVAECDGKVVGAIYYSRCAVRSEDGSDTEVLTFGPLCIDPDYQNRGIGGQLLRDTMELARSKGYKAIIIFGEPGYYPRFGFVTCDQFGITTRGGKNFDAFMGIELKPGALEGVTGRYFEPEVYNSLSPDAVDEFDKSFPYMEKLVLPGQWTK